MDAIWEKLYEAARAVRRERKISDYVEAGCVSAAVLSEQGNIYTGVCIDTACTLGICAERNALFNMITNGEDRLSKVLCITHDGKAGGAPCGACREFMVQLAGGDCGGIEIMMDYEAGTVMTLAELTPAWWIQKKEESGKKAGSKKSSK